MKIAMNMGAEVIHEPISEYGFARWADMQNLPGVVEWILFCDADVCNDSQGLRPFFVAAIRSADLVLGKRNTLSETEYVPLLPRL